MTSSSEHMKHYLRLWCGL